MLFHLAEIAVAIALMGEAKATNLDPKEVACMAQNIYHEARGESVEGQQAVAHVTLNRLDHAAYPDSICGVVHQSSQFSWTHSGKGAIRENAAYQEAVTVALLAMTGLSDDPTRGATHFYSGRPPGWSRSYTTTRVIGGHKFMKARS